MDIQETITLNQIGQHMVLHCKVPKASTELSCGKLEIQWRGAQQPRSSMRDVWEQGNPISKLLELFGTYSAWEA